MKRTLMRRVEVFAPGSILEKQKDLKTVHVCQICRRRRTRYNERGPYVSGIKAKPAFAQWKDYSAGRNSRRFNRFICF